MTHYCPECSHRLTDALCPRCDAQIADTAPQAETPPDSRFLGMNPGEVSLSLALTFLILLPIVWHFGGMF